VKKRVTLRRGMTMTQVNYGEIADKTIRDFLKAVVLIDDHWSEAQSAPAFEDIDPTQLNSTPQTIPPQDNIAQTGTAHEEEIPIPTPSVTDPTYLREIGKEITNQGFLFTGFSYTDALKDIAFKLASKSDILILDWYLGATDSSPALDLLTRLKETSSTRFIFILTDQDLKEVQQKISDHFREEIQGTGFIFNCGPFSFSLKNKEQVGGENSVSANQVLSEAISGIRARFGGLLQLTALELLGQYRNCLHDVLNHFHSETDLPFILEWFEKESPIKDSHSFNALAIDEWTAKVTRRYPPSASQTMQNKTLSALIVEWGKTISPPDDCGEKLKESVSGEKIPFPTDPEKVLSLIESLEKWMAAPNDCWPLTLEGAKKNTTWGKKALRILSMNYLGLRKGVTSSIETLTDLDVLFQCQANVPSMLEQGTVLQASGDNYLICITPACDCNRPERINNNYVFLEAKKIDISTLKQHLEGSVVAIRNEGGNRLLAVTLKPTFTYKINDPELGDTLPASFTFGSDDTFDLKPIAQLRPGRVQSLISLVAGRSLEIGLDRSELLRQLCKSN